MTQVLLKNYSIDLPIKELLDKNAKKSKTQIKSVEVNEQYPYVIPPTKTYLINYKPGEELRPIYLFKNTPLNTSLEFRRFRYKKRVLI